MVRDRHEWLNHTFHHHFLSRREEKPDDLVVEIDDHRARVAMRTEGLGVVDVLNCYLARECMSRSVFFDVKGRVVIIDHHSFSPAGRLAYFENRHPAHGLLVTDNRVTRRPPCNAEPVNLIGIMNATTVATRRHVDGGDGAIDAVAEFLAAQDPNLIDVVGGPHRQVSELGLWNGGGRRLIDLVAGSARAAVKDMPVAENYGSFVGSVDCYTAQRPPRYLNVGSRIVEHADPI